MCPDCPDFDLASIPAWSRRGRRSRSRMHSTRKSILRSCLGFSFCILCGSWRSPRPRGCSRAVCQTLRSRRLFHLEFVIWSTSTSKQKPEPAACHQPNCHNQYQLGVLFRPGTVMICDSIRLPIRVRCIRPTCQGNGIRTHGRTEVSDVSL